ncbi:MULTISPECIES: leucine-rich repeat domain-containing protein [unclassified Chryseobacterium]|uniref:leucine-rich repeat domain-containing protein n=1 Tax=unclassified Chryseobacterium TaxID=2593645 RepID=UPI00285331A0|nr:leucine-rich repeat domain-containing protein [Chryseobacterium sp. CFS7]MDR4892995.1 leucine-rich repeat domain-containing protein [Chryseobacterium sp. CFS7]
MMKIKIFTAIYLIYGLSFFYGQKLEFKDKNFEKTVLENFDLNKNGMLESPEADRVTNLFLVQKGITSTDDLHFFKNVKMIVLDDNVIPNMVISNLDQLELLSCTGCKISSFKTENLKNLSSLYLDHNRLESISLTGIPKIDQLTLSLNQLKTIDLAQCKGLRKLNLEHNKLQKIDISGNPALQTLNIIGNKIKETDIKKGTKTEVTIFGAEE